MAIGINLTKNVWILKEVGVDLFQNQRRLFCGTADNSNQAAGIKHRHCQATHGCQPRLAEATALHKVDRIAVTKHPSFYLLYILQLDFEILFNEHIQVGTPVPDLFNPLFGILDLSDLRRLIDRHYNCPSMPTECNV